jgi:ATP-dependent Clp protease ATP-binding subunit ClpA
VVGDQHGAGCQQAGVHKRFTFDAPTFERFTDRARKVLGQSETEAHRLGHGFVGTEHMLLALFDVAEGLAAEVLGQIGVTKSMVEDRVLAQIEPGTDSQDGKLPFTPRAKAVLRAAVE